MKAMPPIETPTISPCLDADTKIQAARKLFWWHEHVRRSAQGRRDLLSAVANLDSLNSRGKGTRPESVERGQRHDHDHREKNNDDRAFHVWWRGLTTSSPTAEP